MKIEKNRIRLLFYICTVSLVLIIVSSLNIMYLKMFSSETNGQLKKLENSIIDMKKLYVKDIVETIIKEINIERNLIIENEKKNNQEINSDIIEKRVKEIIKYKVKNLRFLDNGYVWINYIVNYSGGDNYAIRLVHPNMPETEGDYLSTNTEDIQGNRPYEIELMGINNYGELFYDYYFKKMGEDTIAHKLSFAKLYKEYDWVIATGVYLDDVDKLIQEESESILLSIKQINRNAIISIVASLLLSITLIILFEHKITKLILDFQDKLNKKNAELSKEKRLIEKIAYLDPLTEILNRRAMINKLKEVLNSLNRRNTIFTICMADIDNFKQINDKYGHDAGDMVLKKFTLLVKENIRVEDTFSRWGGEEFIILLNSSDINSSFNKLNIIRSKIEDSEIIYNDVNIKFTVSFGSVTVSSCSKSYEALINAADINMYKAKKSGKNCVVSS